mgnify:CR=1 FL=1
MIRTCVSLYSLQDEYLNKRMNLRDIMHFVKENGAEGCGIHSGSDAEKCAGYF